MAYSLVLSARAERDIEDFLGRLLDYDPAAAAEFEADLRAAIRAQVLERPHT